jgi:hypothetical protein
MTHREKGTGEDKSERGGEYPAGVAEAAAAPAPRVRRSVSSSRSSVSVAGERELRYLEPGGFIFDLRVALSE